MALELPAGPTFTVESSLSAATGTYGAWNAGLWDTATWGPDAQWTDITAYARAPLSIDRRFSRNMQTWESGTASVVLANADRRFSPDNLSSPYAVAGVSAIRPWRPLRIRAGWKGVTYDMYNGYALTFEETWLPGHVDSIVTVPCTDELARLAGFDGLEQAPQGAGEPAGRRIHRILNAAGHTGLRAIDVGRVTMQATTLSQDTLAELKLTTDSEGGGLFIDADGSVVFEDQYALLEQGRSRVIQATFGDGSGRELPCADIGLEYNGDLITNIASFARVGGTPQTSVDNTSRALYGDRRTTRTDLVCESDAQAQALATFWVERFKAPELRITQIKVTPASDPDRLWPQVLGRRVRDLIRVVARPIGGATVVRDCHIAGIHHKTDGTDWTTTFDLWDASVYQRYSGSRWDVGMWGASDDDTAAAHFFF